MGFENKYPYTDFHELNLDWILEVVKGIETEWPEFRTEMQTAWQQYQDNLTGEGGEWPTFRDEMTQDFDDFIHLFIDEFGSMSFMCVSIFHFISSISLYKLKFTMLMLF